MKITRRQLRRLVETTVFPKNPVDYISDPEQKEKINTLINSDNEENRNMGYELAIMLQDDDIDPAQKKKIEDFMPPGATMDQRMGYAGDDYLDDLNSMEPQIDRDSLITKYENFFKMKKLEIDKNVLSDTSNLQLLSTLAMLAPFNKIDKQAILESPNLLSRVSTINSILDLNTFQVVGNNNSNHLN